MRLNPAWETIFRSQIPVVKVLDLKSDVSDLTTYTFSACNLGDLGSDGDFGTYQTDPHMRSPSHKKIYAFVHGEDALSVYSVSTVTIGGVGLSVSADSGGGNVALTTIAHCEANRLQGITNTDVVVTFSEAVTSCGLGLVSVSNIATQTHNTTVSNTGTGGLGGNLSPAAFSMDIFSCLFLATTLSVTGETVTFDAGDRGCVAPMLLYEFASAEATYAAAWTYSPQDNAGNTAGLTINANWSGAGTGDGVGIGFI